jgi:hypothetical protein
VFLVIGLGIGIVIGASGHHPAVTSNASNVTDATQSPAAAPSPSAPTTSTPAASTTTPAPVPSPNASGSGSCSYTLAGDPSGSNYLTAEVDVTNTGNIGVTAKVSVSWPQEGFSPIKVTKTVKIPYGANSMPISFNYNAGSIAGGSNVIDNLQAWENGHPGSTDDCTYNLDITGTYGDAH